MKRSANDAGVAVFAIYVEPPLIFSLNVSKICLLLEQGGEFNEGVRIANTPMYGRRFQFVSPASFS